MYVVVTGHCCSATLVTGREHVCIGATVVVGWNLDCDTSGMGTEPGSTVITCNKKVDQDHTSTNLISCKGIFTSGVCMGVLVLEEELCRNIIRDGT